MTTIAYKDGILAADSQGNWNGTPTRVEKIMRGDGFILVGSGDLWRIHEAYRVCEGIAAEHRETAHHALERPDVWRSIANKFIDPLHTTSPADTPALLLIQPRTGNVLWLSGRRFVPITFDQPFVAIGSGSEYALGAMLVGASAEDAVRAACVLDVNSGGKISVLDCRSEEAGAP